MRVEKAAFIDETCSVACSTNTGELHECVCAPFGLVLMATVCLLEGSVTAAATAPGEVHPRCLLHRWQEPGGLAAACRETRTPLHPSSLPEVRRLGPDL